MGRFLSDDEIRGAFMTPRTIAEAQKPWTLERHLEITSADTIHRVRCDCGGRRTIRRFRYKGVKYLVCIECHKVLKLSGKLLRRWEEFPAVTD